MKKGINEIISVILLISILFVSATSLYYYTQSTSLTEHQVQQTEELTSFSSKYTLEVISDRYEENRLILTVRNKGEATVKLNQSKMLFAIDNVRGGPVCEGEYLSEGNKFNSIVDKYELPPNKNAVIDIFINDSLCSLRPANTYYYRLLFDAGLIGRGQFQTTAAEDSPLTSLPEENKCSSCADCSQKIQNANPGDTIYLEYDIDYGVGLRISGDAILETACILFDNTHNITFDGQGHYINGNGYSGVYLKGNSSNNLIKDLRISYYSYGVYAEGTDEINTVSNNVFLNSIISYNFYPVLFSNVYIENNTILNSSINNNSLDYTQAYGENNVFVNTNLTGTRKIDINDAFEKSIILYNNSLEDVGLSTSACYSDEEIEDEGSAMINFERTVRSWSKHNISWEEYGKNLKVPHKLYYYLENLYPNAIYNINIETSTDPQNYNLETSASGELNFTRQVHAGDIMNITVSYVGEIPDTFIFQIDTQYSGGDNVFSFWTNDAVNLFVDWGDGTNNTYSGTGLRTHTYANSQLYNISLQGEVLRFYFFSGGDEDQLVDVLTKISHGITGLTSASYMFRDTDNFGISGNTLTEPAFFDEISSNITTMNSMFYNSKFNQDISSWDTSNVIDMTLMFAKSQFDQPLNSWNTSNVMYMTEMFSDSQFNKSLNLWDTSNVQYMPWMFYNSKFNQDISSWDTSNVIDMSAMLSDSIFNQPLNSWNVSNVTNMELMFQASVFNQDISSWDVSNVEDMFGMFGHSDFNQPLNSWNVSSVTNMKYMFEHSFNFNQPLDLWDVSNVQSMREMFRDSYSFNQNISSWNVSSVIDMGSMFANSPFDQPLNSWDVSNVEDMFSMFSYSNFNQDISSWNVSNVVHMENMLDYTPMSIDNYDSLLLGWSSLPSLQSEVTLGAQGLHYCNGETARQNIINDYGWDIYDAGADCGPCFLSGTQITMSDKTTKNIEEIKIGDKILTYNLKENLFEPSKVTKLFKHSPEENPEYYLIINNKIKVTPNHRVYINNEWEKAENLQIGDVLFPFQIVTDLERVFEQEKTYNLEIEKNHNYLADEILAHNVK